MPSARELLEQADALMRKNRSRGNNDIPLLTDAVAIAAAAESSPAPASAPISATVATHVVAPTNVSHTNLSDADVPLLTDEVEEVVVDFEPLPEQPIARGAIMEGDPSDWLVMDTIDPAMHSITGRAPDTLAAVPPPSNSRRQACPRRQWMRGRRERARRPIRSLGAHCPSRFPCRSCNGWIYSPTPA
jgi:hypothetical protein